MGITREGRFAALTNFRDPAQMRKDAPSRGSWWRNSWREATRRRAISNASPLWPRCNGYNLLVGNGETLWWASNMGGSARATGAGHVWRVQSPARYALAESRRRQDGARTSHRCACRTTGLCSLLRDDGIHPDDAFAADRVPLDWERLLSAAFVKSPDYGTRSSTVLCGRAKTAGSAFDEQTWLPGRAARRTDALPLQGPDRLASAHHGPVRNPGFHEFRPFLDEAEAPVETAGMRLRVQGQVPQVAALPPLPAGVPAGRGRRPCRASRPAPPCGRCARPQAGARCRSPRRRHRGHDMAARRRRARPARSRAGRSAPRRTPIRAPPRRPAEFIPVEPATTPNSTISTGVRRHQVEQLDDVAVAHAHAADRTRGAHRHRIGRAVQIDVAAHGVDLAEPVAPRLLARQPEDARQDPVAAGKLLRRVAASRLRRSDGGARIPCSPSRRRRLLPARYAVRAACKSCRSARPATVFGRRDANSGAAAPSSSCSSRVCCGRLMRMRMAGGLTPPACARAARRRRPTAGCRIRPRAHPPDTDVWWLRRASANRSTTLPAAPVFGSRAPNTTRATRACMIAPAHMAQGSRVT
jgi:uncharacterized protein with NRDE domain